MDKDLLYRFFEGHASLEDMKVVKEWAGASEENAGLLRRERKLFNAMILAGHPSNITSRLSVIKETGYCIVVPAFSQTFDPSGKSRLTRWPAGTVMVCIAKYIPPLSLPIENNTAVTLTVITITEAIFRNSLIK